MKLMQEFLEEIEKKESQENRAPTNLPPEKHAANRNDMTNAK